MPEPLTKVERERLNAYRVEDWGVSDEYRKAPLELHVVIPGSHAMMKAIRTGITLPGPWPSRAAYNLDGEYYVFEGKCLIPYDEWHEGAATLAEAQTYLRSHGYDPDEVAEYFRELARRTLGKEAPGDGE